MVKSAEPRTHTRVESQSYNIKLASEVKKKANLLHPSLFTQHGLRNPRVWQDAFYDVTVPLIVMTILLTSALSQQNYNKI